MKKNYLVYIFSLVALAIPTVSFAFVDGFKTLLNQDVPEILSSLWTIVIALAFLWFFWGLIGFIRNADNEDARAEGQQKMLWGIVALTVIISIYGVLYTLGDLVGIPPDASAPSVPALCSSTNTAPNCIGG